MLKLMDDTEYVTKEGKRIFKACTLHELYLLKVMINKYIKIKVYEGSE